MYGTSDYNSSVTQGGIGMGPLSFAMKNPRSVQQQMFNLSPSQRARGMAHEGDLEKTNQARYLSSALSNRTRLDREKTQLDNNQSYNSLNVANNAANQYHGIAQQFNSGAIQNSLNNYNHSMGLLAQIFGGGLF